jgi:hypothetical protein
MTPDGLLSTNSSENLHLELANCAVIHVSDGLSDKEYTVRKMRDQVSVSPRTTDHEQATGKLYHLRLRVKCILFCNLQSQVRTHAVLAIGLYELLGNPTT